MSVLGTTTPSPVSPRPSGPPATPLPSGAAYTNDPVWRMSVRQYHAMIATGTLTEGDRVELLEGVLVYRMPQDEIRDAIVGVLATLFAPLLAGTGMLYRAQSSLTLTDGEPIPDGKIVRGDHFTFVRQGRHPGGDDTALVVEVSNTTSRTDRGAKLHSYARAGIAVYWVVDVGERTVEVYADPEPVATPPAYGPPTTYRIGDRVPVVVSGKTIGEVAVETIFP